jgi:hypothetical protein
VNISNSDQLLFGLYITSPENPGAFHFYPAAGLAIFRRFTKATNFTSSRDSFILTRQNINYQRQQDTVMIFQLPDGNDIIISDYDYEVFLPKINRLFRISEIVENIQYGSRSTYKVLCGNTISSYKVNGQMINDNHGNTFLHLKK